MTLLAPIVDPGGEYYFSLGASAGGIIVAFNSAGLTNAAPVGRSTSYGFIMASSTGGQFIDKNLPSPFNRLIMGGAYYIAGGTITNNAVVMALMDNANLQCELRTDSGGHLFFSRNGAVIGSASGSSVFSNQGWVYIEIDISISQSSGQAVAWVNGNVFTNVSGVNTQATSSGTTNRVRFGAMMPSPATFWKDMYALDTTTGLNTSRLGDITVTVIYPTAAGVNQQFTNVGASTQVGCVQDGINHTGTWPDGDTTYIMSNTAGQISDFAHQTISLTGNIIGVLHASYCRKDDAGVRNFNQVCLSNGTTESTSNISLGNSYIYYFDTLETDPHTGAAWTLANFNAATFGVRCQ